MVNNMFGQRRDLRFTVLTVLRHGKKNGVEIMDSVDKVTFGMWRPSPGSLYPMLQKMVDEGLIKKDEEGKYSLVEGEEELNAFGTFRTAFFGNSPRNFDEAIREVEGFVSFLEDLKVNGSKSFSLNKERLEAIANRMRDLAK
jgi:DNA-binding PadR family transcriptional regulator